MVVHDLVISSKLFKTLNGECQNINIGYSVTLDFVWSLSWQDTIRCVHMNSNFN